MRQIFVVGAAVLWAAHLGVFDLAVARPQSTAQPPSPEQSPPGSTAEVIRKLLTDGRLSEAAAMARDHVEDVRRREGREALAHAEALDLLVSALRSGSREEQDEARSLAAEAIEIKRSSLGPDDPRVADSLIDLARLLAEMERLDEAESAVRDAIRVQEMSLGPKDDQVVESLHTLAGILTRAGHYARADSLYQRQLEILREAVEPADLRLVRTLYSRGALQMRWGEFELAKQSYRRGLQLLEQHHGVDHPRSAWFLNGLGSAHDESGDFIAARDFYERTLAIVEQTQGPESAFAGSCHNNLGLVLRNLGDYEAARRELERALAIAEVARGEDHPTTASTLKNLAELARLTGDLERARDLHQRALSIRERVYGPDHPWVGTSLEYLAAVYVELGEFEEARRRFERAVKIKESTSPEHPDLVWTLNHLARVHRLERDLPTAIRLCERSLEISAAHFGKGQPLHADVMEQLALLRAETGRAQEALKLALEAETISRDHVRLTATALPERQALGYASVRVSPLDVALSVLGAVTPDDEGRVWDAVIRSRALVLDEMAQRNRTARAGEDGREQVVREQLEEATRRLANVMVQGPDPEDPSRFQGQLEQRRTEKEKLERELAAISVEYRTRRAREHVGLDEVAKTLGDDEALVAYVRYRHHDSAAAGGVSETAPGHTPLPCYGVFALRAASEPRWIRLGPAEEIEAKVQSWSRRTAVDRAGARLSDPDAELACRAAGDELRRAIWDPVASYVDGARRVYLVPEGALHLVSFAALPVEAGLYLVESGPVLHYLSAERDLVRVEELQAGGRGLLALGGVDFDGPGAGGAETTDHVFRGSLSRCVDFRSLRFESLPATAEETLEIADLWKGTRAATEGAHPIGAVTMLSGAAATEAAVKRLAPGHRVLHLATHGFFLSGRCVAPPSGTRGIGSMSPARDVPVDPRGEHPLLLSGLALAGANRRLETEEGQDDGILTAQEIAAMDLASVEWAVLSACDTGAGKVQTGEGILGLRRAFQTAGVARLVMSLWPAEDDAARAWMQEFYQRSVNERMEAAAAARAASVSMIQTRRREGRSTHPFTWGGWIVAGSGSYNSGSASRDERAWPGGE